MTRPVRCAAFEDAKWHSQSKQARAYELFKSGIDTFEIGKRFGVHESFVCRWVDRERNHQKTEQN